MYEYCTTVGKVAHTTGTRKLKKYTSYDVTNSVRADPQLFRLDFGYTIVANLTRVALGHKYSYRGRYLAIEHTTL